MARPPKARLPLKLAALELFVEHGVHGTGIRDIAKHAGCSEAALYRHWANKEALVSALFREHLGDVRTILEQAIAGEPPSRTRCAPPAAPATSSTMSSCRSSASSSWSSMNSPRACPSDLRMPQDVVTDLIKAAVANGDLRREVKGEESLLAAAVIGIFLETAVFVLYGRLPGPLSRYVEQVTQAALRVVRR
jgi:AcrR family transcriptional regulator